MKGNWLLRVSLVVAGLVLVLSACAKPATTPAPGATPVAGAGKTFKWYHMPDLTGPVAVVALPLWNGVRAYTEYINTEKGGIAGRKVELEFADTGYEVPRVLVLFGKYKAEKPTMVVVYSSGGGEALKPMANAEKIVAWNYGASDPQLYPPQWNWAWGPSYGDGVAAFMDWAVQDWRKKGGTGAPKIGFITYDNPFGKAIVEPGIRYAKHVGMEYVGTEFTGWLPADTTPQLTKLRDAGANYLYTQHLTHTFTVVLKDMAKLDLQGKIIPGIFWWGPLDQLIESAGPAAEHTVWVGTEVVRNTDLDNAEVKKAEEYANKIRVPFRQATLRGWAGASLMLEGVRRTVDKVGWDGLNPTTFRDHGLLTLKGYNANGVMAPAVYTQNDRRTQDSVRLAQVQGGKVVWVTPMVKAPHTFLEEHAGLFPGEPLYK